MGISINTPPAVSIIMPAYNAQDTISDSIKSVQKQGYTNWELIVIDDHSDDRTIDIVKHFSKTDPRIKYIKNKGQYVSAARNTGIEISQGKYLTFLDADDIYYNHAIEVRLNYLIKHKSRNAVFCKTEMTNDKFESLGWQIGPRRNVTFKLMHTCPFHINSLMIEKKSLGTIRFPIAYKNGEDWLFFQRLARTGLIFYRISGCYITYRQHSHSTVQKDFNRHGQSVEKVLKVIYGPDPECPNPDPRYAKGLTTPSLQQILRKRRFTRFTMCILEGNLIDAKELAATFEPKHYNKVPEADFYNIIKFSFCRYFGCHIKEWRKYWKGYEQEFFNLLNSRCPTDDQYPPMGDKLSNIMHDTNNNKILRLKYHLKRFALRVDLFLNDYISKISRN